MKRIFTIIYLLLAFELFSQTTPDLAQVVEVDSISNKDVRINGVHVGKGGGYNSNNTRTGASALQQNTSGTNNSAVGFSALNGNTTGSQNTAFGSNSLLSNSTANYNTAIGTESLYSTSTGGTNTSIGYQAGYSNTTGTGNVFIGHNAGYNATSSDKLFIDNSSTSTPLIYGDFANDTVKITSHAKIITSTTTPLLIGGETTTSTITYKPTTAIGATGADHIFQVGNNGGTEAMRILNSGNIAKMDLTTSWSANQLTAFGIQQNQIGDLSRVGSVNGGLLISGYNKHSSASTAGIWMNSYVENEPTSNGAIRCNVYKHDGSGGLTSIASTSRIFVVGNNSTGMFAVHGTGSTVIGSSALLAGSNLHINKTITGSVGANVVYVNGIIQSDVTAGADIFVTNPNTAAAAFTLSYLSHYSAYQNTTLGAGSAITSQYGFRVYSNLTRATNNYGFYGDIASGSNRWNLYMNGNANNYLAGKLGIGQTAPAANLEIVQTAISGDSPKGIIYTGAINTNQTASTEISSITFTTAGRQWATGNITLQREVNITSPTYSFVGASTITDAVALALDAPKAGTNATLTRSWAAQFTGNFAVSASTYFGGLTTAPNSTVHIAGSFAANYVAKTASYTAGATDYCITFTSGTDTLTLPTAVGIAGRMYVYKNMSGNAGVITTTSSQTIDGNAPPLNAIADKKSYILMSNGANWIIISTF